MLAIYIRDVTKRARREGIHELGLEASQIGVDFLLVKDTMEAAQHAVKRGCIAADALPAIEEEKKAEHKD